MKRRKDLTGRIVDLTMLLPLLLRQTPPNCSNRRTPLPTPLDL